MNYVKFFLSYRQEEQSLSFYLQGIALIYLWESYHLVSTYGSYILTLSFLLMAYYLIKSIYKGKVAGSNPWGALTMEWKIPSPAPPHNFLEEPKYEHGPYAYDKVIAQKTIEEE